MIFLSESIIGGLLFGIGMVFVLLPMARAIQARLERQWKIDAEEHALYLEEQAALANQWYTRFPQSVFILVAGVTGYAVVSIYGASAEGIALAIYYFGLLLLVAINVKSTLLPDVVVLPMLWFGLLYFAYSGVGAEHIYGAAAGYMAPFTLMLVLKSFTGKEVIGGGDLKAVAMAGAWFGTAGLPLIFAGLVIGFAAWILIIRLGGRRVQGLVCTGPAHLIGSLVATLGTRVF